MQELHRFLGVEALVLLHGVDDGAHAVNVHQAPDRGGHFAEFLLVVGNEALGDGIGQHVGRGDVDDEGALGSGAGQFHEVGVVVGIAAVEVGLDAQSHLLGAQLAAVGVVTGEEDGIRVLGFDVGQYRGEVLRPGLDLVAGNDLAAELLDGRFGGVGQTVSVGGEVGQDHDALILLHLDQVVGGKLGLGAVGEGVAQEGPVALLGQAVGGTVGGLDDPGVKIGFLGSFGAGRGVGANDHLDPLVDQVLGADGGGHGGALIVAGDHFDLLAQHATLGVDLLGEQAHAVVDPLPLVGVFAGNRSLDADLEGVGGEGRGAPEQGGDQQAGHQFERSFHPFPPSVGW